MYECRKIYEIYGVNYEGEYEIDTKGIVYSLKGGKRKALKPEFTSSKKNYEGKIRHYCRVALSKNNKVDKIMIHNIMEEVLEDLISVVDKKEVINHKDHDGTNNNIENIEFCSVEYNQKDRDMENAARLLQTYKDGRTIYCIETGKIYRTINEAARSKDFEGLKITPSAIGNALRPKKDGTRRICKGYHFDYLENYFKKV